MIGLRPGEKLYEELLIDGNATGTAHPRIWQARETPADAVEFAAQLRHIESELGKSEASLDVNSILQRWVAGYAGRAS